MTRGLPLIVRSSLLVVLFVAASLMPQRPGPAATCDRDFTTGLYGEYDRVDLRASESSLCDRGPQGSETPSNVQQIEQPYDTYQVACSPIPEENARGDCRSISCPPQQAWAYRIRHYPDGREEYVGGGCISLEDAEAAPGVSVAQVLAALRQVQLPGGQIKILPQAQGLVNLESYFWLEDVQQPPVDLTVGGTTVTGRFHVREYRWAFGDGTTLVTSTPGVPGQASEVRHTYRAKGERTVRVRTGWVAEAWVGGELVVRSDDFFSTAQATYPVREVKTRISG